MKRLLPVLMGFVVLLLSSTEGWSLPICPGSPTSSGSTAGSWTDCVGTITTPSGMKYVGEFKDGSGHGHGTFIHFDGSKYVGEFKDGSLHGQGSMTYADGRVWGGTWENGMLQHIKKSPPTKGTRLPLCLNSPTEHYSLTENWTNCFGTRTHSDGTIYYVGEWKDGKFHGQGSKTFPDGRVKQGIWENDVFLATAPTVTAKKTTTYNPEHWWRLIRTRRCPNCKLQGAELEEANLNEANLQGANLQDANLPGADLMGADLKGTKLQGAKLRGAYLQGAKLQGAWLQGAKLQSAKLHGAYLQGATLSGANLQGADLTGANLMKADLRKAKLDPEGVKIAKATGAINVPEPAVVAKKTPKVIPKRKPKPPVVAKVTPKKAEPKPPAQSGSGSGFFVSRFGHVITNEHVVRDY